MPITIQESCLTYTESADRRPEMKHGPVVSDGWKRMSLVTVWIPCRWDLSHSHWGRRREGGVIFTWVSFPLTFTMSCLMWLERSCFKRHMNIQHVWTSLYEYVSLPCSDPSFINTLYSSLYTSYHILYTTSVACVHGCQGKSGFPKNVQKSPIMYVSLCFIIFLQFARGWMYLTKESIQARETEPLCLCMWSPSI
jgi:hypothetical protein